MLKLFNCYLIATILILCIGVNQSFIIYSSPQEITNLNCNNEQIVLNNPNLTFNNTVFNIIGNCFLSSWVGNFNVPIQSLTTTNTNIYKLKLNNISLLLNGSPTTPTLFNDFLIEMGTYSSITFNGIFNFKYNQISTSSNLYISNSNSLIQGGTITIPSENGKLTLENTNVASTQFSITSVISNFKHFEVKGFRLALPDITKYQAKPLSLNYFNEGIQATTSQTSAKVLEFHNCTVLASKLVNLQGGVLSLSKTEFLTLPNGVYTNFQDTKIRINTTSVISLYHGDSNSPITAWRLDSPSTLSLLNGQSSVSFRIYTSVAVYYEPITEALIHSAGGNIDCGIYSNNVNSIQWKSPTGVGAAPRLTGITMCSNRNIASRIYVTAQWVASNEVNVCADGYYACVGLAQCIPLNQTCQSVSCVSDSPIVNPPYNGEDARCWNGECAIFKPYSSCSPYPACPLSTPLRCSGKCVAANETCGDESLCLTKCVEGCYNVSNRECQPFNGCPLYQYQCPNNECVNDISQCSSSTANLPFSNRYINSFSTLYANIPEVFTAIYRELDSLVIYPKTEILLTPPSINGSISNALRLKPVGDSKAQVINGQLVKSNFNYYNDLLTAPFSLKFNTDSSTTFASPVTLYFSIPQYPSLANIPLCLAFANPQGQWECTPYTPVLSSNNVGVFVQTSNFASTFYALLLKDPTPSTGTQLQHNRENILLESDQISTPNREVTKGNEKRNFIITISLVSIGIIFIVVAAILFINLKLKNPLNKSSL